MYGPDGTRYDMMNGGGGWMVGFAVLTLVLLAIAVMAVLANLFLHVSHRRAVPVAHPQPLPEARVVLDGRLARGDISVEEYRALRAVLQE